ncbi:HAD family hydrolase [Candidatus Gracilibacteria bacterium]|nr:HAD family hydrolase [Candidatus Gracilibacteria bacterium]MCF7819257.1 HAD family hydrolase [Candidatus Gracilibacteria bacterium]
MTQKLLLACDMDRTVLPNGQQPISPQALARFRAFTERPEVTLAYLTGRDLGLIRKGIQEYKIPLPDLAVGDVGTTVYIRKDDHFEEDTNWACIIGKDWNGYTNESIGELLQSIPELTPQEPEKQNTFKRSYYTDENIEKQKLIRQVREILEAKNIKAAIIFSIDEQMHKGLLDILPLSATKEDALKYLCHNFGFGENETVYAGDSGNDIQPLTSGYRAILVANARDEVRREILEIGKKKEILEKIYCAQGNWENMNGNYTAGILEGLAHFGHKTE